MNRTDAAGWITALHLIPKLPIQSLPTWIAHFPSPTNEVQKLIEALRLAYPQASSSLTAVETLLQGTSADWLAVRQEMTALHSSRAHPELRPFAFTACAACLTPCAYGQVMSFAVASAPGLIGGLLQARQLSHPHAMNSAAQFLVNSQLPVAARLRFGPQMAGDLSYCLLAHCLGDEVRSTHSAGLTALNQRLRGAL